MAIDKYHQSVSLVLKVAYLYYIENKPQNERFVFNIVKVCNFQNQ